MMKKDSRVLAVTMGDPAGVGPELCLRLLDRHTARIPEEARPVIYGDMDVLNRVAAVTGLKPPPESAVRHISVPGDVAGIRPGIVDAVCGRASYEFLRAAIESALSGSVDAIVTAPINKEALQAAAIHFPGHTEILAHLTGAERSCMLQFSDEVTASFVTCHCGYSDVPALLTRERLREVIDLTHEAVGAIQGRNPRMMVLGLNPHAGEHGLFGRGEEEMVIMPEVVAARSRGMDIRGPVPPDTAFIPAVRPTVDAYVCMYHDQGHIPLKALAFDRAVNVTLGLPVIRTSVDHGTAYDIAWQGKADPGSLFSAVTLACRLCRLRDGSGG